MDSLPCALDGGRELLKEEKRAHVEVRDRNLESARGGYVAAAAVAAGDH